MKHISRRSILTVRGRILSKSYLTLSSKSPLLLRRAVSGGDLLVMRIAANSVMSKQQSGL